MRKMDQFGHRLVQCLLICLFIQLFTPLFGVPEHSGMGVHKKRQSESGIENLYLFVMYVLVSEYGKKLDKQAKCPVYCGTDHKHNYYEKEKSNIQGNDGVPGSDKSRDTEQPESDLRPIASTDRLRGDAQGRKASK